MINEPKPITVLIADDHKLYLDGLKALLDKEKDIKVLGEAKDGAELVGQALQYVPDVILTDLKMPGTDGVEAIKTIKQAGLPARCIALSTFDADFFIIEALEAGALGYINKNAQPGEIVEAVRTVSAGKPYLCSTISTRFAIRISKSSFNPFEKNSYNFFPGPEKNMIVMICDGKTSEEIGKELFMSPRTVEGYRSRILQRAGVKNNIQLVIYAIKNGLYSVDY
jgi:DNA-binding NarL/FixJ family response regulator